MDVSGRRLPFLVILIQNTFANRNHGSNSKRRPTPDGQHICAVCRTIAGEAVEKNLFVGASSLPPASWRCGPSANTAWTCSEMFSNRGISTMACRRSGRRQGEDGGKLFVSALDARRGRRHVDLHQSHATAGPPHRLRHRFQSRARRDGAGVLEDEFSPALLDAAVDDELPARGVRRVRDLSAGTVPEPLAQHGQLSFCYNLGRFAAAAGSLFSAQLATQVYQSSTPAHGALPR